MQYRKVLFTATCLLGMAGASMAAPVGMVVQIDGSPSLKAGGRSQALRKLQRVEPGSTISCGSGESATVVLFASGERFTIGGNRQGTVQRASVSGATSLGKLGGASSSVAGNLRNSRNGAVMGRVTLTRQDLSSASKGWLPAGERTLTWQPIKGATSYTFALCDRYGNVMWSTQTEKQQTETGISSSLVAQPNLSADYPANAPTIETNRPYIWRLTGYGAIKPLPEARWGIITWLSKEDADALTAAADDLQAQADANPANAEALLLQKADLASDYGVFDNTFDTLDKLADTTRVNGLSKYDDIIRSTYADIGPFATYLYEATKKSQDEKKPSGLLGAQ